VQQRRVWFSALDQYHNQFNYRNKFSDPMNFLSRQGFFLKNFSVRNFHLSIPTNFTGDYLSNRLVYSLCPLFYYESRVDMAGLDFPSLKHFWHFCILIAPQSKKRKEFSRSLISVITAFLSFSLSIGFICPCNFCCSYIFNISRVANEKKVTKIFR
jgi:hypothetical protein